MWVRKKSNLKTKVGWYMNQHEYKTDLIRGFSWRHVRHDQKGPFVWRATQSKLKQKQSNENIHGYCMCPCWSWITPYFPKWKNTGQTTQRTRTKTATFWNAIRMDVIIHSVRNRQAHSCKSWTHCYWVCWDVRCKRKWIRSIKQAEWHLSMNARFWNTTNWISRKLQAVPLRQKRSNTYLI